MAPELTTNASTELGIEPSYPAERAAPNEVVDATSSRAYQVLNQISAGQDGVAYEAVNKNNDQQVELWKLVGTQHVVGREEEVLQRLSLVQLLRHPATRRVHTVIKDGSQPIVILETSPPATLKDWLRLGGPDFNPLTILRSVVGALDEAHKLGLSHEAIYPESIRLQSDLTPQLDFTRLSVTSPPTGEPVRFSHANELPFENRDIANDSYCVGQLIDWLLEEYPEFEHSCHETSSRHTAELRQLAQSAIHDSSSDRPSLARFVECFSAFLDEDQEDQSATEFDAEKTDSVAEGYSGTLSNQFVSSDSTAELSGNVAPADSTAELSAIPQVADSTAEIDSTAGSAPGTADLGLLGPVPTRKQNAIRMPNAGERLGRYQILKKIGEGGMGAVYQAEDISDGSLVAIKVLSESASLRSNSLQRFHKEARLLAAVNNPHVANLIEVNEQDGLHYIVLEFVEGVDLKHVLALRSPLAEEQALSIAADIARALVDAHQSEIVHRDIKPENVLLDLSSGLKVEDLTETDQMPRVKLTDFGIARHVNQSESLAVTQAGGILGTPMYMSPEQCKGKGEITPQSDVYALGITLYEMLGGKTPFQADDPMKLAGMHCFDAPPALRKLNPQVSELAAGIVDKAIAKKPIDRYADAAHILRDLDQLLRGEPSEIAVHPLLPEHDPLQVIGNEMMWELKSSPEQLWPMVANTERLNRAIGLPPVKYSTRVDENNKVRRFAEISLAGFQISWEEHPFEWIEGRRMSVLREFKSGPFKWFTSTVELERTSEGGTNLKHCVKILPRNMVGKLLAKIETGSKCQRSLGRVYSRMDETLSGKHGESPVVDPFEPAASMAKHQRERLENRIDLLIKRGVDTELAQMLGDYVAAAPAQELAKIRPLELAERLQLDSQELVDACLLASAEGLLMLQWDILCPTCRVAADTQTTLKELKGHTHCEACNTDFDSDIANSVEMVFRVNSDLRKTELDKFCIGGPGHSPHVVAQVRIEPTERIELELNLPIGEYLLRGPQLAKSVTLKVRSCGAPSQHEVVLNGSLDNRQTPLLRAGKQLLWICNEFDTLQVVRLERTIPRNDVVTAAQASALPRFRELFPGEVLDSGQLISTEQVTMVVTTVPEVDAIYAELGDAAAYELLQRNIAHQQKTIQESGGAVIKTVGEGVVAAFDQVEAAVEAAFQLDDTRTSEPGLAKLESSVGIHRGPALVTTVNDRLDYFGATARIATALPHASHGISMTEPVYSDPLVHEYLQQNKLAGSLLTLDLPGKPNQIVQCFANDE